MDQGREKDLEELATAIKDAPSRAQREHLEKIAYKVMNESTAITSLRKDLIGAFKVKDIGKVKRIQQHIQAVRLEETRGTSWGQSKGEKIT